VRDIDDGRTQNLGRRENPDSRPFLLGTSIKELRAEVARRQGWDISHVRMLYGAKELEDSMWSVQSFAWETSIGWREGPTVDRRTKETNTLFTYGFQDVRFSSFLTAAIELFIGGDNPHCISTSRWNAQETLSKSRPGVVGIEVFSKLDSLCYRALDSGRRSLPVNQINSPSLFYYLILKWKVARHKLSRTGANAQSSVTSRIITELGQKATGSSNMAPPQSKKLPRSLIDPIAKARIPSNRFCRLVHTLALPVLYFWFRRIPQATRVEDTTAKT